MIRSRRSTSMLTSGRCSKLCNYRRRRRACLLNLILIILCICAVCQIKYDIFDLLPRQNSSNVTACSNVSLAKSTLNCSGDPLKDWCASEMSFCQSSVISYHKLFLITRSVILQAKHAEGKRLGGEDVQSVLNQPENDEYFHFRKGFLKLPCDKSPPEAMLFPSHLSSILSSITSYQTCSDAQLIVNETTIAVNRQDYVNFYHTITDLYTAYLLCRFFQRDPKSVRILFIDAHPRGSLDILWSQLFHSYTRLGHLKNVSTILYKELIWAQPQPKSEIDITRHRKQAPSFFADFREHTLRQFHVDHQRQPTLNCQSVQVFFLGRRNYVAHPRNPTGKITRQLPNEQRLIDDLKTKFSKYPTVNFTYNYFEQLSIEEQLKTISHTDVFVGVHGAGLTHAIFLKSGRVLVELSPSSWHSHVHFELMAGMSNVRYHRCAISGDSSTTAQTIFECTKQQLSHICPSAKTLSANTSQIR